MQQQTALMSPTDLACHNGWRDHFALLAKSMAQKAEEAEHFRLSHRKKYAFEEATSTSRLLEPKAFPLLLRHTLFNEDGTVMEIQESVWNSNIRVSPLADEVRVRAAKKQAAARSVVKVESRDDRQVAILDPVTELYVDLGRTNAEARPNSAVQALRKVDFSRGALYSGGQSAVRAAMKQAAKYSAMPAATAEKSKAEKIRELEQRIAELTNSLRK
jgi:hypothetical protein